MTRTSDDSFVYFARIKTLERPPVDRRSADTGVLEELIRRIEQIPRVDDASRAIGGGPTIPAVLATAVAHSRLSVPSFVAVAGALRAAVLHEPNGDIHGHGRRALQRAVGTDTRIRHSKVRAAVTKLEAAARAHSRLSEAELAREVGLHPSHLGRLFRLATGLPFGEWRRALLMQLAIRRLIDDGEQVAPIAYELGFRHPTQFSREFRQLVGLNPRKFYRLSGARGTHESV